MFYRVLLLVTCICWFDNTAFAQARLMSEAKDRDLRSFIPDLVDDEAERILKEDPSTVYYSIQEMPRAFQFAGGNGRIRTSFHWAGFNFSGDNDPPFYSSSRPHGTDGNANVDFPWRMDTPGGTHRSRNVTSFKACWLPKYRDGDGKTKPYPIVWFTQNLQNPISGSGFDPAYGWIHPSGTRFFEVLLQYGPNGMAYVFEIRERRREIDLWEVEIHRPFPTAQSLAARVKELRPNWQSVPQLNRYVGHLEDNTTVKRATIEDRVNRTQRAFHVAAGVDLLPDVGDDDLVSELLMTTQFGLAGGEAWKIGNDSSPPAFAASYEGRGFNIVPAGYDGTFMGTDRKSCMKCHESTNVHARLFDRGRGWYGYVSGSDGIISMTLADPRTIQANGAGQAPVRWRESFVQTGMVEQFNAQRHPNTVYRRIKGLK